MHLYQQKYNYYYDYSIVFTVPKTPFNTTKSTQILSAHNKLEVFLQTTVSIIKRIRKFTT